MFALALQAAIPDLSDLRAASETLHCMHLRGFNVKTTGRHVTETAFKPHQAFRFPGFQRVRPRMPRMSSIQLLTLPALDYAHVYV